MVRWIPLAMLGVLACRPTSDAIDTGPDDGTDPAAPVGDALVALGTLPDKHAFHIMDVARVQDRVFVASMRGMQEVDSSNPDALGTVGHPFGGELYWLASSSDLLLSSSRVRGITAFEVTPGELLPIAELIPNDGVHPEGVVVGPQAIFAAAQDDGLQALDRSTLRPIGHGAESTNAIDVALDGDVAWVADRDLGVLAFDVSDPTEPTLLGSVAISSAPQAIEVADGVVWVAASGALVAVDGSDPTAPEVISVVRSDSVALRLDISEQWLALANWRDTRVYDISDPSSPLLLAVEDADQAAMSVTLLGDTLYVGDWNTLRSYSFDPTLRGPEISMRRGLTWTGEPGTVALPWPVSNEGHLPLVIESATCDGPETTLEPLPITIEPGASTTLTLTASLQTADPVEIGCALDTNDPDEATTAFLARYNPHGLAIGDVAPSWTVPDLQGTLYSLSDFQGEVLLVTLFSSL